MREVASLEADDDYSPWDADEREDSDEDDSDDDDEMAPWHPSDLDGRYSYDDDSEEDDTNPNLAAFFPGEEPPRAAAAVRGG